jgi:hypothetical protein
MLINGKSLVGIILFFLAVIVLIIYRYERLINEVRKEVRFDRVDGVVSAEKKYTAQEIIALIKSSKEYINDSITIFNDGKMNSDNQKFQGTIMNVIESKDNMEIVKSNMNTNKLPIQYNIYILAATYYRWQYPAEFSGKK